MEVFAGTLDNPLNGTADAQDGPRTRPPGFAGALGALGQAHAACVAPDGAVWVADRATIRRIDPGRGARGAGGTLGRWWMG